MDLASDHPVGTEEPSSAGVLPSAEPAAPNPGSGDVVIGDDGRGRCRWGASDPEYRRYHDEEWGVPLHGDRPLFEKLCLEGFQAGLSWITILRRRPAFRRAFAQFDPAEIARFGEAEVARLMDDESIIRNRAKILATIGNARVALALVGDDPGALDRVVWAHAPSHEHDHEHEHAHDHDHDHDHDHGRARGHRPVPRRPRAAAEVPAITQESTALSTELRALGFRFVGPTTVYALMQSAGLVDDHLEGCWRADDAVTTR